LIFKDRSFTLPWLRREHTIDRSAPDSHESLERRLRHLEDIRAIEQLKYRYTAGCDFGYDLDEIAGCFTENGRWISNGFADLTGRQEIRDYFERLSRYTSQALHYTTSPRITIEPSGDRATAEFYLLCLATVRRRGSTESDAVVILGSYTDICIKIDDKWFFEELRVDVRHSSDWTEGWAKQPWRLG
jgi:hypothetical protein